MILVAAATDFEMRPFAAACKNRKDVEQIMTGIGPVETAVRLTSRLSHDRVKKTSCLVNFGVAGAYTKISQKSGANILDICLAKREIFGDLGIRFPDRIERFVESSLKVEDTFLLDAKLFGFASKLLAGENVSFHSGTFITVSCASGTAKIGELVAKEHEGLCENMEGAAIARVCKEFDLPCLEIRCISNMVEDRDKGKWQLKKACKKAGEVTAMIVDQLLKNAIDFGSE